MPPSPYELKTSQREWHEVGREVEREQCCKDVCHYCRRSVAVERGSLGTWWHPLEFMDDDVALLSHHLMLSHHTFCAGSGIRERAWREKNGE